MSGLVLLLGYVLYSKGLVPLWIVIVSTLISVSFCNTININNNKED